MIYLMCNDNLTINLTNKRINMIQVIPLPNATEEKTHELRLDNLRIFAGDYESCVNAHRAVLAALEEMEGVRVSSLEDLMEEYL